MPAMAPGARSRARGTNHVAARNPAAISVKGNQPRREYRATDSRLGRNVDPNVAQTRLPNHLRKGLTALRMISARCPESFLNQRSAKNDRRALVPASRNQSLETAALVRLRTVVENGRMIGSSAVPTTHGLTSREANAIPPNAAILQNATPPEKIDPIRRSFPNPASAQSGRRAPVRMTRGPNQNHAARSPIRVAVATSGTTSPLAVPTIPVPTSKAVSGIPRNAVIPQIAIPQIAIRLGEIGPIPPSSPKPALARNDHKVRVRTISALAQTSNGHHDHRSRQANPRRSVAVIETGNSLIRLPQRSHGQDRQKGSDILRRRARPMAISCARRWIACCPAQVLAAAR